MTWVPECQRRGEVAEEEVGDGQGHDERVPRVEPELPAPNVIKKIYGRNLQISILS
jgi:hypothetical protein